MCSHIQTKHVDLTHAIPNIEGTEKGKLSYGKTVDAHQSKRKCPMTARFYTLLERQRSFSGLLINTCIFKDMRLIKN